jgi:hypothetical protein
VERKLENTMGNILIVRKKNYELHTLDVKNLMRMISERKNMQLMSL